MFFPALHSHWQKTIFSIGAIVVVVTGAILALVVHGVFVKAANATLPCDIYAANGTPCVAAHSTVRALLSSYTGNLYQVQRASDSQTTDIGILGGYADAARQDTFCAGTTCIITIIYDQSGKGNHLTIEGPGGAAQHQDAGADASALPVFVNGHKAYGVSVTPGVGYANRHPTGTATGSAPEGEYMVASGTHANNGCCFDYGNTETTGNDDGNGHMDAVNLSTRCEFSPCSGSGPRVLADLENGLFAGGNGSNMNNLGNASEFVTALLKNNGTTTYAIKGGNSQSGGLTTWYNGPLPNLSGYTPMQKEGGILMGTGGDNSDWDTGSFFEGVMTSGYPTDAADDAVQANIVLAGYVPYYTPIVPTSEQSPQSWKYTTNTPASGWQNSSFDESGWSTGNGGFGTAGTPGAVIGTTWNTSDLWLRRHFNPGSLTASQISSVLFRLHHDEGAELYINGVLAAQVTGYVTGYYSQPMTTAAQNAVVSNGDNVLAIHVNNTTGGQYIDAGIDAALALTPTIGSGWAPCANEGGTCSFSGTAAVAYGAAGQFAYGTFTNGVSCSNGVFDDPDYGVVKSCFVSTSFVPPTPGVWTQCAGENGTCSFSGTKQVAYGNSGHYAYGTFTNGTACTNSVFSPDPDPGVVKACFTAPVSTSSSTPTPVTTPASTPALTPTPTSTPGSGTGFTYGVVGSGSTAAQVWFQPTGTTASYVIVHYSVTNGAQQNVSMTYNSSTSRWEERIDGMGSGVALSYAFTYNVNSLQSDTPWYTWTHP
jgi:non-reducing end alpha-L-arabinofuranosidase